MPICTSFFFVKSNLTKSLHTKNTSHPHPSSPVCHICYVMVSWGLRSRQLAWATVLRDLLVGERMSLTVLFPCLEEKAQFLVSFRLVQVNRQE